MRKTPVKLIALLMAALLLQSSSFSCFPAFAKQIEKQPKNFGIMADLHLFPESLIDTDSADFQYINHANSKLTGESEAVLKSSLETIAAKKAQGTYPMDYLLIAGDLSFEGEKPAHQRLAAMLKEFEQSTGIQVFVINGNHDVNNDDASSYTAVPGRRITARENPGLLMTKPGDFKTIYADFGYNQADSVYVPKSGKAGMLSYSVSLPGGYRLIAIDSCVYAADVTDSGKDLHNNWVQITPDLLNWVCGESRAAVSRGETVIGLTHGNIVEHFDYQAAVAASFLVKDYERISYELADAGMHFVFTGHNHSNDTAAIVSGNNEIIYDLETCGLTTYPNIYREAAFNNTIGAGFVDCKLTNTACDDQSVVDISGVSDTYGCIEKPFSSNYCMPMLLGGSIENGVKSDAAVFLNSLIAPRLPGIIKKFLPNGIGGLLQDKGIDFGTIIGQLSPELNDVLAALNLSPAAFSDFLDSVIAQVDNQYILNTDNTVKLATSAVSRLSKFELAEGNEKTELGKLVLLGMCGLTAGDENVQNHPEAIQAINALRTQAGADRVFKELLDILVNDMLFNDILPSIYLNDLDKVLPARVMSVLRSIAGNDLTAGGVLDKVLNAAASGMKGNEFFKITNGRDVVKDIVYTAGYRYLNPSSRLKIGNCLADVIYSMMQDNNPEGAGDSNTTLHYSGKVSVRPSAENYRLPADVRIVPGPNPGEVTITWNTICGIDGTDIEFNPLPLTSAGISTGLEPVEKQIELLDTGFYTLGKTRTLLSHSVTLSRLETGVVYGYRIGDAEKAYLSESANFRINADGTIERNVTGSAASFFGKLLDFINKIALAFKTITDILHLFP